MNSLEFINENIEMQKVAKDAALKIIKEFEGIVPVNAYKESVKQHDKEILALQQIKTELKLLNELKNLINTGDIFSPSEFYDDYESCLKGDGSATFITKDLKIIEDFEKGWKLLQEAVDGYDTFSPHKCKISFVVWFNR